MHYSRHTCYKFIYTSYSLRLSNFLNSLTQCANFFKIHQIYNIKKAIGVFLADFEEISKLYEGIKKMVQSQTVRCINKLVAIMLSLMHYFAAIAGSIREKQRWIFQGPPPLP